MKSDQREEQRIKQAKASFCKGPRTQIMTSTDRPGEKNLTHRSVAGWDCFLSCVHLTLFHSIIQPQKLKEEGQTKARSRVNPVVADKEERYPMCTHQMLNEVVDKD